MIPSPAEHDSSVLGGILYAVVIDQSAAAPSWCVMASIGGRMISAIGSVCM
jgi:hypothetical protein